MNEEIFKVKKDRERAEYLFLRAKDRFEFIPHYPRDKTYKIIEESYESIKELLTSLMYLMGYKTLSHVKLLEFMQEKFHFFDEKESRMVNTLRKFRNGTMYYGEKINADFLDNHFDEIAKLINKLLDFVEGKINDN